MKFSPHTAYLRFYPWFFSAFLSLFFLLLLSHAGIGREYHNELLKIIAGKQQIEFQIEVANTPQKRAQGLMYRKSMPKNAGMLFCFDRIKPVSMWMKNTELPLDIIFIRPDGTIASITENTLPFSTEIIFSGEAVLFVLEVNAGIVSEFNIKNGDKIEHSLILSCTE